LQSLPLRAPPHGIRPAIVLILDHANPDLLLLAEHGVSSDAIADFQIGRHDVSHPLVQAMDRRSPTYFAKSAGVDSPLGRTSFHAIPLQSDEGGPAHGLLLASASGPALSGYVAWLVRPL